MREADLRALFALHAAAHGPWAPLMIAATVVGGGWGALALVPMLWHGRARPFAAALGAAIGVQAVLVWAVKLAVGRVRPWIAFGWAPPLGAPHDGSFPSGHAAGSFCVAAFLFYVLPASWPHAPARAWSLAGLALVLAALVALSRVVLGAHFPSDVAGGALVGATVGGAAGRWFARSTYTARSGKPRATGPCRALALGGRLRGPLEALGWGSVEFRDVAGKLEAGRAHQPHPTEPGKGGGVEAQAKRR